MPTQWQYNDVNCDTRVNDLTVKISLSPMCSTGIFIPGEARPFAAWRRPLAAEGHQWHPETGAYSSSSASLAATAAAWPSTFTRGQTAATLPALSIRNVERCSPIDFLPYMFFSTHTPYFSARA